MNSLLNSLSLLHSLSLLNSLSLVVLTCPWVLLLLRLAGKPKGIAHTQAGYLLYTATTHKYVFDYRPGDVYACVADCGWITGHSYIVYGPLCNGATTLMFESTPMYPDAGRYWDLVQRHKVTQFYTAPTAIRALMRFSTDFPNKYDLSSLRVLGSVGEPINPEAWKWYYDNIGKGRCAIVDTYWQTETCVCGCMGTCWCWCWCVLCCLMVVLGFFVHPVFSVCVCVCMCPSLPCLLRCVALQWRHHVDPAAWRHRVQARCLHAAVLWHPCQPAQPVVRRGCDWCWRGECCLRGGGGGGGLLGGGGGGGGSHATCLLPLRSGGSSYFGATW